jgi:hypothetical protein
MCLQYILLENGGNSLLITHLLTTSLTTPFSHFCAEKIRLTQEIYPLLFYSFLKIQKKYVATRHDKSIKEN